MTSDPLSMFFIIALSLGLLAVVVAFAVQSWRLSRSVPVGESLSDRPAPEPAPAAPPSKRDWTSTEYDLTRLSPDLSRAAWAGAIPHAFDANVLRALAPELADRAGVTYLEVQKTVLCRSRAR